MLSKELITELQQIIKEEYQEDLSFAETQSVATSLISFFSKLSELEEKKQ